MDKDTKPPRVSDLGFYVLSALVGAGLTGRHGYALIKEVQAGTGKLYTPPSLYDGIKELIKAGLAEEASRETVSGRPRVYYRITPNGTEVYRRELRNREVALTWAKGFAGVSHA